MKKLKVSSQKNKLVKPESKKAAKKRESATIKKVLFYLIFYTGVMSVLMYSFSIFNR